MNVRNIFFAYMMLNIFEHVKAADYTHISLLAIRRQFWQMHGFEDRNYPYFEKNIDGKMVRIEASVFFLGAYSRGHHNGVGLKWKVNGQILHFYEGQ